MILVRAARIVLGVSSLVACGCSVPDLDFAGMHCTDTCPGGLRCVGGICGGHEGGVPVSFVQSNSSVYEGATSVSAFDCALSTPATSGDLLVAAINFGSQPGITVDVTDSRYNAYKRAIATGQMAIFYAANVAGGVGSTNDGGDAGPFEVTASFSTPTTGLIMVLEYGGIAAINALDRTNGASGNDQAVTESSGSLPVTSNELVFGFGRSDEGVVEMPSPGFHGREYAGGAYSEDFIAPPPPGPYAATFTPPGDSGVWTSFVASFHGN